MSYTNSADRMDAGESTFTARALEFVETSAYNELFPPLEGRTHIPTVSVDAGAQSVSYRQYKRTGLAKLVTEDGSDLPTAGFSLQMFNNKLYLLGASYQYTDEELRAAALAMRNTGSLNIDTERAAAARQAIDRAIDVICAIGTSTNSNIPGLTTGVGADVGLKGLLNVTGAATYVCATGAGGSQAWTSKTPDEVVADLNGLYAAPISANYKLFEGNRILLPIAQYQDIKARRMGDGSDMTILSYFLANHPGVQVDSWQYCKGAGSAGSQRAVLFNSDPRFLRLYVAREFTQEAPQKRNLNTVINCTAKVGGVVTPYPLSVTYMDNI